MIVEIDLSRSQGITILTRHGEYQQEARDAAYALAYESGLSRDAVLELRSVRADARQIVSQLEAFGRFGSEVWV